MNGKELSEPNLFLFEKRLTGAISCVRNTVERVFSVLSGLENRGGNVSLLLVSETVDVSVWQRSNRSDRNQRFNKVGTHESHISTEDSSFISGLLHQRIHRYHEMTLIKNTKVTVIRKPKSILNHIALCNTLVETSKKFFMRR